jgi:hypothetical protein
MMDVMSVKDREKSLEALRQAQAELRRMANDLEQLNASLSGPGEDDAGTTVRELAEKFNLPEEAVVAFAQSAGELLAGGSLSVKDARRAGILAAAGAAWEHELGPLLSSAQVRELLGDVSRQRVDELLRARRLIGLRERSGRRRYPLFQFDEGRPIELLVTAFWIIADAVVSDWTAASWCVTADPALDKKSALEWARGQGDPEQLLRIARQDAARLAQ